MSWWASTRCVAFTSRQSNTCDKPVRRLSSSLPSEKLRTDDSNRSSHSSLMCSRNRSSMSFDTEETKLLRATAPSAPACIKIHSAIASLQLLKLISAAKDCRASRHLPIRPRHGSIHLQIGLGSVCRGVHPAGLQQLRGNGLAQHVVGDEGFPRSIGVRIHRHHAAVFGDRERSVALQPLHELILR